MNGEGGLFQYRNTYPDDPFLHYWTGLALARLNRAEQSQHELAVAHQFGLPSDRLSAVHLTDVMK